jgi:hypothetical protein
MVDVSARARGWRSGIKERRTKEYARKWPWRLLPFLRFTPPQTFLRELDKVHRPSPYPLPKNSTIITIRALSGLQQPDWFRYIYASACSRNCLWTALPLKMELIFCPETSITKYLPALRHIPEQQRLENQPYRKHIMRWNPPGGGGVVTGVSKAGTIWLLFVEVTIYYYHTYWK